MSVWVKICGVTTVEDALVAVKAGADAVGVNLVASSKRRVDAATARAVREAVGDRVEVVAVVADLDCEALEALRAETGIEWLQLHGDESPDLVRALLPSAYKVLHVAEVSDIARAAAYPGARLLADAKVTGALGGTGQRFDWGLVRALAGERQLIVAGGLTPENVAQAIAEVRPFGVDTASGVEGADPRRKDPGKVERFVRAARAAPAGPDGSTSGGSWTTSRAP